MHFPFVLPGKRGSKPGEGNEPTHTVYLSSALLEKARIASLILGGVSITEGVRKITNNSEAG